MREMLRKIGTGELFEIIEMFAFPNSIEVVNEKTRLREHISFADAYDYEVLCGYCNVNAASYDSEPGCNRENPFHGYSYQCERCFFLRCPETHAHTYYYSDAQLSPEGKQLNFPDGWWRNPHTPEQHTWRTAVTTNPVFDNGVHKGWICAAEESCGWFKGV